MSFIDTYMKKYRIGEIIDKQRKNLEKLEEKLNDFTSNSKNGLSFLDAIKKHGDQISDLIERVRNQLKNKKASLDSLKFIYSICIEIYQIIDQIHDDIVPDGITGKNAWVVKRQFGIELVYFIWRTIGPLDKSFNWIPFKKAIEKKLVYWIAGMGIDAAHNLFTTNKEIKSFSFNNEFIKAI